MFIIDVAITLTGHSNPIDDHGKTFEIFQQTKVVLIFGFLCYFTIFFIREVIFFDLISGGKINQIMSNLEDFKNIPDDMRFEIFQSSFGAVEICLR